MTKAFIALLLIALLGQKSAGQIFMDQTDKFTGIRGVSTQPEKLIGNLFMVAGNMKIDSSGTSYYLSFIQQKFTDITSTGQGIDTTKGLTIILEDGRRVKGEWVSTTIMEASAIMPRSVSTGFSFTKSDFVTLSSTKATDFKMTGSNYHIMQMELSGKKQQEVFIKISNLLLAVK
ncbi:MAG: hypothetical protein IPP99_14290 [Chitinophagaceae bacterium]|nr:hypothetical protein [Chitinophagaceae bacterium]